MQQNHRGSNLGKFWSFEMFGSLSMNGEVMMSTIKQMSNEGVFLSSLGRCWHGFNILDGDPLKYQIYTYEVLFPCFVKSVAM